VIICEVDFNDLATVDGRQCVVAWTRRCGAPLGVGDRVRVVDRPEVMEFDGEVVRIDPPRVFIAVEWEPA
jgi:hypothetical protein